MRWSSVTAGVRGESAGTGAEVRHPTVHGRVAGGHVAHCGELQCGEHAGDVEARTAPVWMEVMVRSMSPQCRSNRARSTRLRAVSWNGRETGRPTC